MKVRFDRSTLIKLTIIAAVLLIAPFAVPFTLEFVLMADILGLEALLLFLLLQSRQFINALLHKLSLWRDEAAATLTLLLGLYMFQRRVALCHTAGSLTIVLLACSVTLALALWIPALYFSTAGVI